MRGSSEASLSSSPLLSTPLTQPAVAPQHQDRNSLWNRHLAQQVLQGALPASQLLLQRAWGSGAEWWVLAQKLK